jgi:hypothetical protein
MVMTAYNTPKVEERLSGDRIIPIFEKPVDFDELAQAVLQGIDGRKPGGLAGISLASFLQLLRTERKSCLIEVTVGNLSGFIIMKKGELYSAAYNNKDGVNAMYAMLDEEDVQIELLKLPHNKVKRKITMPLMGILVESMKRKDDAAIDAEPEPLSVDEDPDLEIVYELVAKAPPEDELKGVADSPDPVNNMPVSLTTLQKKGVEAMSEIAANLEKIKAVEGFMAAGFFFPRRRADPRGKNRQHQAG